jgi:zinc/manganese transport system ATP-binding protein
MDRGHAVARLAPARARCYIVTSTAGSLTRDEHVSFRPACKRNTQKPVSGGPWCAVVVGGSAGCAALGCDCLGFGNAVTMLGIRNLTLTYDRHPAVHHLDGDVARGSMLAVVGPNGAGKSTLLRAIAGLHKASSGAIEMSAERTAYLPQASDIDRTFPLPVFDLVTTGLFRRTGWFGGLSQKDRQAVGEAIAAVGLTGFEHRLIGTLSGGQLQRALFARVLVQDADLILLDEPFTAIDSKTTADLVALIKRWHSEERTVIAVLHDLDTVKANFPETLLLAREEVAWGRTGDVLTAQNLLNARQMIEAPDVNADTCGRAA